MKLQRDFHLGAMHDGDLDDMVVYGNSVLEREVMHARQIPG